VFDDTRTFDGVYPYTFEASDAVGNRLLLSLQITVDTTPPAIEILGLSTNERTTDDHVRLRGTVSAGSTLTVNGAPVAVDCALGPSGNCDYDVVIPLPVGTNPISLVATDGAGNQAARNIFVQRAEAPVAPAGPDLSFALVLLGVVGGVALMLFFFRRARTEAAAKHPQLTLGKGKKRRLASAPPPPAQVIYEGSGQDMYAADFQTRSQRQARPPYGGA
jgi:hypothetical protein